MSIILFAVCLPVRTMLNVELPWIILTVGLLVAAYTVAGGLEAVIWTDLLQAVAMFVGAMICLPIIVLKLPGGLPRIFTEAYADGKLSVGSTALALDEKTMWVMIVLSLFVWLHIGCQDQQMVQRYCAPKSEKEARKALVLGALLSIPVWTYFTFLGTALYVFYKVVPDPYLTEVVEKPEQILPYFILREVPTGLAGFVICGIGAAAVSTLDSSMNAVAATLTTDFYRRLLVWQRDERHYLKVGRWISCLLGLIMIAGALAIHHANDQSLADLQTLLQSLTGGGLLALTLLGMLTIRVDSRAAVIAVVTGFFVLCAWLLLDTAWGRQALPGVAAGLPDKFWTHVLINLFVFTLGYGLSVVLRPRRRRDLGNLTIWTLGRR